ncbi:hypothetical protein WA538_000692 [Blastocystis sp. DL]
MLVLVALHVTKVVSTDALYELIVCIYKKAGYHRCALSHSNITVEEEDASITPLSMYSSFFHLISRIHTLRSRWMPPLLLNLKSSLKNPLRQSLRRKFSPPLKLYFVSDPHFKENHIEEFATVDPVPVAVAPAPESEDIAEELPTEAPHAPELVQLFADTHAQGNHMEEPCCDEPPFLSPQWNLYPFSVCSSSGKSVPKSHKRLLLRRLNSAIIEEFAVAEAAIEQPAVMEAAMEEPVTWGSVAEPTAVEPFVEEPIKVAEAPHQNLLLFPLHTHRENTEELAVPVSHPTHITFEELAALDPAIIVDSSLSPESNTLPAGTAPLAVTTIPSIHTQETITERLMVEERSSNNALILLGNSIIQDLAAFDQEVSSQRHW